MAASSWENIKEKKDGELGGWGTGMVPFGAFVYAFGDLVIGEWLRVAIAGMMEYWGDWW